PGTRQGPTQPGKTGGGAASPRTLRRAGLGRAPGGARRGDQPAAGKIPDARGPLLPGGEEPRRGGARTRLVADLAHLAPDAGARALAQAPEPPGIRPLRRLAR